MIHFTCPSCGKLMMLRDECGGRKGKCACGSVVRLPIANPTPTRLALWCQRDKRLFWVGCAVGLVAVSISVLYIAVWRDTWERDHRDEIILLADRIAQAAASGRTADADRDILQFTSLTETHELDSPQLKAAAQSVQNISTKLQERQDKLKKAEGALTDARRALDQDKGWGSANAAKGSALLAECHCIGLADNDPDAARLRSEAAALGKQADELMAQSPIATPPTRRREMSSEGQKQDQERFTTVMEELYRRHRLDPKEARRDIEDAATNLRKFSEQLRERDQRRKEEKIGGSAGN